MSIPTTALLLLLHGGCTTSSAFLANQPQVKSVELTEPWKSMNLPIDGALIERSSNSTLGVRFVTIKAEDAALPYAALKEALVKQGWVLKNEYTGPPAWDAYFEAPGYRGPTLSVTVENDRPLGWLSARKAE